MRDPDEAPREGSAAGEPTFGERFLAEYRTRGGMTGFSYAEIQEIKGCDREGLVRALRAAQPLTSYAAIQRIRSAESPEALARELWYQHQMQSAAAAVSLFGLFAMLT